MDANRVSKANRILEIDRLSQKLKGLLPKVLEVTGFENVHSLNAKYGSKIADFMDIEHEGDPFFRAIHFIMDGRLS